MEINDKRQRMADKVAKLLRQAEDVTGTPEESVFQAKAFEILAKYGIDQAMIDASRAGIDASSLPADAIKWSAQITGTYASAQAMLINSIARALHCRCVYSTSGGHVVHVFGMPNHIDRVRMLWDILQPQMVRMSSQVRPEWGTHVRRYRRAWIAGFASTIGSRVREQETKAVEEASSSGALVLYRGDVQRAEVALRDVYPRTTRSSRSSFDTSGYRHGQRDGQSASMSHAISA